MDFTVELLEKLKEKYKIIKNTNSYKNSEAVKKQESWKIPAVIDKNFLKKIEPFDDGKQLPNDIPKKWLKQFPK